MDDLGKSESESKDRLSELPDSLILQILSLLPMNDVVRTTILSKRWHNLWTTLPCLNFWDYIEENNYEENNYDDTDYLEENNYEENNYDDTDYLEENNYEENNYDDTERIRNFVYSALSFWKGNKIMKFEIAFEGHFDLSLLATDVDVWVCFAKENNVEELNIHLNYDPQVLHWDNAIAGSETDIYVAPQCLNSCSSIKRLSLVGCNLRVTESLAWNQLLSLSLDGFCFSEGLINTVLSGAPQLEVFTLRLLESHENLNIQSTSLKKLKIEKFVDILCDCDGEGGGDDEHPSTNTSLRIECPNLEVFEIAGFLYAECVLTNVPSLSEVSLGFGGSNFYDNHGKSGEQLLGETLRQIFSAIQHFEKVTLSDWCVQVLGASENYLLSPLSNVKFLKLAVSSMQLDEMTHLLGIFPNIKTLVIEDQGMYGHEVIEFESNLPNSFLFQLKTVEITSPFYDTAIYGFMEFVLKHARMLEKMVVWARTFKWLSKESFVEVAGRLLRMPRSSKTAKVILRKS